MSQTVTYRTDVRWLGEHWGQVLSYECRAEGTKLIELDRTEVFSRLHFRPEIRVAPGNEPKEAVEARVRRALAAAKKYSLVANSVRSEIVIEARITIEERDDAA